MPMYAVTNRLNIPLNLRAVDGASVKVPANSTMIVEEKYVFPQRPDDAVATVSTDVDLTFIPKELRNDTKLVMALSGILAKVQSLNGGNVPVAPSITSVASVTIGENTPLFHTLVCDQAVVWTISGGADAVRFELAGNILRFAGNATKNYEAANDSDTNNIYVVKVTATNNLTDLFTEQTITVIVTDVLEPPQTTANPVVTSAQPGVYKVGVQLSVSTGSYNNNPTSFTYQWVSNGTDISGATSANFTPADIDQGASIACRVTATNADGSVATLSAAVGPILVRDPQITVTEFSMGPSTEVPVSLNLTPIPESGAEVVPNPSSQVRLFYTP